MLSLNRVALNALIFSLIYEPRAASRRHAVRARCCDSSCWAARACQLLRICLLLRSWYSSLVPFVPDAVASLRTAR